MYQIFFFKHKKNKNKGVNCWGFSFNDNDSVASNHYMETMDWNSSQVASSIFDDQEWNTSTAVLMWINIGQKDESGLSKNNSAHCSDLVNYDAIKIKSNCNYSDDK